MSNNASEFASRLIKAYNHTRSIGAIHTKKEFAEAIGWRSTHLSSAFKGDSSRLTQGLMFSIADAFPCFNRSWLLTGEGDMLQSTEDLSVEIQSRRGDDSRLIPFYDAETTGGYEGLVSSSDEEVNLTGFIQAGGWFGGSETAAIRHVGDSMVEYPDGCVLVVREVTERRLLVPGKNYVIETNEYRVTKRIQRGSSPTTIALYSSNKEKYEDGRLVHEPFEVEFEDIRRIYSVLGYIVNQSGEYRLIKP